MKRMQMSSSAALAKVRPPTEAPTPVTAPVAEQRVKFTAVLDASVSDRFERVTADMRAVGRLAGGRYPSRADVLRAVLALVEEDDDLLDRVRERVRDDLTV